MITKIMVAGVSATRQYFRSTSSFMRLLLLKGDSQYVQHGTRGDVAREMAATEFLKSDYNALLLMDLDQEFDPHTINRLREHNKDMVSAHYMKRTTGLLQSIWQYTLDGEWPYLPYLYPDIPKTGMHRIASTGMGCVLIMREVIEAVKEYLNETQPGANPFEIGKIPELTPVHTNFGSDYRFFWYAQKLGFELWGDADIETPHASSIWLHRRVLEDMTPTPEKIADYLMTHQYKNTIKSRGKMTLNSFEARRIILDQEYRNAEGDNKIIIGGQLAEIEMWMRDLQQMAPPEGMVRKWAEKRPDNAPKLPTFSTQAELDAAIGDQRENAINGMSAEDATAHRKNTRQNEAVDAAKRMSLYNKSQKPVESIQTSTDPGEMVQLV
jgi:hypothetical protein